MRYVRDIPADSSDAAREAEEEHVRAHLAAVADADDDPATRAADVGVWTIEHPERPDLLRIVGELDAEPDAPYLRPGFDPYAGVDPALFATEVGRAILDEEKVSG